uniref:Uncharacterized protein n=1 Tax=Anopheles melas TaxID=34690 RepID=A0A182UED3_9DIPT
MMLFKRLRCIICVATVLFVGLTLTTTTPVVAAAGSVDEDGRNTNKVVNATDAQPLASCNATSDTGTTGCPLAVGAASGATQPLRGKLNNGTCVSAYCGSDESSSSSSSVEEMDDDVINATSVGKGGHSQQQHRSHLLPSTLLGADEDGAALMYGGKKVVLKAEVLKHTSVLYGLISVAERDELSERCFRELQRVYHGIQQKEIWAMKGGTAAPAWSVLCGVVRTPQRPRLRSSKQTRSPLLLNVLLLSIRATNAVIAVIAIIAIIAIIIIINGSEMLSTSSL